MRYSVGDAHMIGLSTGNGSDMDLYVKFKHCCKVTTDKAIFTLMGNNSNNKQKNLVTVIYPILDQKLENAESLYDLFKAFETVKR